VFRILAILKIRNFTEFAAFESQAAVIMADYGGRIASAFETGKTADDRGEEIHLLEFPDRESFQRYTVDSRLLALSPLRELAISATEVKLDLIPKSYDQTDLIGDAPASNLP